MAILRAILVPILSALALCAAAQGYPAKPVRMVVPWPPGYASFDQGSMSHLAGELLKTMAKIDILHIPYKGGGAALIDALAFKQRLDFEGASEPIGNTPDQMAATVQSNMKKLVKLVQVSGLQPQ